jgi:hypothetical protein
MTKTVEMLKARINLLQQRDPVANSNIINKLKRRIRLLEQK